MNNNLGIYIYAAIVIICLGLAVFYIVHALQEHSNQISCLTTVVNQALNEAFHHAPVRPGECK